jgi:hypothetical protein
MRLEKEMWEVFSRQPDVTKQPRADEGETQE